MSSVDWMQLPPEVWAHIYLCLDSSDPSEAENLKSFRQVCTLFKNVHKLNFKRLPQMRLLYEGLHWTHACSQIRRPPHCRVAKTIPCFNTPYGPIRITTVREGEGGCYWIYGNKIYFFDFAKHEDPILLLDLNQAYNDKEGKQRPSLVSFGGFREVLENENGLIVVVEKAVSIWEFSPESQPIMKRLFEFDKPIYSVTRHENGLICSTCNQYQAGHTSDCKTVSYIIDSIDSDAAQLQEVTFNHEPWFVCWGTVAVHDQLLLVLKNGWIGEMYGQKASHHGYCIEQTGDPLPLSWPPDWPHGQDRIYNNRWLVEPKGKNWWVFDVKENEKWNISIKPESCIDKTFIQKDILFLFSNGAFEKTEFKPVLIKAIHLPTRMDLTEKWSTILNPVLLDGCFLAHFSLENQKINLFFIEKINEEELQPHFVQISLTDEDSQKEDLPIEFQLESSDSILDVSVFSQPSSSHQVPEPSHAYEPINVEQKPTSLINRVTVAVGFIFLFLTAGGTLVLIILHPGMVVYQGGGLFLTLPAVLTLSIGGSASLVIIAIGSYRWWKENKLSDRS